MCFLQVPCARSLCCLGRVLMQRICAGKRVCRFLLSACRVSPLVGLPAGEGWAYGYDAIGSHEKVSAVCSGTGQTLIQPVLDNQIEFKQQWGAPKVDLSLEATVELIRDAFTSAGERDIYTGDFVEICKITKDGVDVEEFQLKLD